MRIVSINSIAKSAGSIGFADLIPAGDRGPTFGQANADGIQDVGKFAGFWTSPYDGIITAVTMSVDQGGARIVFRRRRGSRGGIPGTEDIINKFGYTIGGNGNSGGLHQTFTNLTDFLDVNVFKGDVFTAEIVQLFDPKPTDTGGNILVSQTDGSIPGGVVTLALK